MAGSNGAGLRRGRGIAGRRRFLFNEGSGRTRQLPMNDRDALLERAAQHARDYLHDTGNRLVRATAASGALAERLRVPLPETGEDPARVLDTLAEAARTGTAATQGPRFFGFVVGSSLPVATAADWLVSAW